MEKFRVDRRVLSASALHDWVPDAVWVAEALDWHLLADGVPFVLEDDGTDHGCWSLNRYVLEAVRLDALKVSSLGRSHVYHLFRFLRFLRDGRDGVIDLVQANEHDLVAYKRARQPSLSDSSWDNEVSSISGFYHWAQRTGLIDCSPVPRWGSNQRNLLRKNTKVIKEPKYLDDALLRAFLDVGLRRHGDATAQTPERDYVFGLVLVGTGFRRQECAHLLDIDIPAPQSFGSHEVVDFVRVGKKDVGRRIFVTHDLAGEVDRYRRGERRSVIERHQLQRRLSKGLRSGELIDTERSTDSRGRTVLHFNGNRLRSEQIDNETRIRLIETTDDGMLNPLSLFVSHTTARALSLESWNAVFDQAHKRLVQSTSVERPPADMKITPHVLRHTYAVRMLAGLMRIGKERLSDPYAFITSPLITVQQLLGHASPETTAGYLRGAEHYDETLTEAIRAHVANVLGGAQ